MSDHITVVGRVGTVPKRIERGDAPAFVTFRLVSSNDYFDQSKKTWIEADPNWYTVNARYTLAENVERSLQKGMPVIVTAKLVQRHWTDDKGVNHVDSTLHADSIGNDLRRGVSTFTLSSSKSDAPADSTLEVPAIAEAEAEWHVPVGAGADLPF